LEKSTELIERIKLAREEKSTLDDKPFQITSTFSEKKLTTLQCKNNDA